MDISFTILLKKTFVGTVVFFGGEMGQLVFKCTDCVSVPGMNVFDKMECVYLCVQACVCSHHQFQVNS